MKNELKGDSIAMKFYLKTKYGDQYHVLENGDIKRLDIPGFIPSGQWKCLGLVELRPFGNIGPLIPLSEAVKLKTFTFKNGKPRYTVVDFDHGTRRLWGNTVAHGVVMLRKLEVK